MFSYVTTEQIQNDIARFNDVAKRLDVVGTFPRTWSGRMRRDLEAEAVGSSVRLEGVPVTIEEVRRILAGDRPPGLSDETTDLVTGYWDAMRFVLRRADDPVFAWNPEIIRTIHSSVMAGSWSARAGLYRDRQVWIAKAGSQSEVVFLPPANEDVPQLVTHLTEWLQSRADSEQPLITAALAHVWLAAVHPFRDGNGRTARIVASLVMYRGGYRLPQFTSLEEWWGAHSDEYYAAFECLGEGWQPDVDVTPFVAAHVAAQRCQADALALRYATERLLWTALEDIVEHELQMNPRAANALWDTFFGREVSNRYYRGTADIPQVTASHDLKQLQTSGMLISKGSGRSRLYEAGLPLYRRLIELFSLNIETGGGAPDKDLRASVIQAIAEKATCA